MPENAGTYTFTLEAYNMKGADLREFTIKIIDDNLTFPKLNTQSLPNAIKGRDYEFTLDADGGKIQWTVTGLPKGLEHENGVIKGTPTESGEFILNITMNNRRGGYTEHLTLLVANEISGCVINASTFPDNKFRAYISEKFDTDHDGKLSANEIASAEDISVCELGITSLEGLKYFTALKTLKILENNLKTFDVSKNTLLNTLLCNYCSITSLNLNKNANLVTLYCDHSSLAALDLNNNSLWPQNLFCNDQNISGIKITGSESNYQFVFSSLGLSSGQYANIQDVKAFDSSGSEISASYNKNSGVISFSSIPVRITYNYTVQYNKLIWNDELKRGVGEPASVLMNATLTTDEHDENDEGEGAPVFMNEPHTGVKGRDYSFQFAASGAGPIKYSRTKGSLPNGIKLSETGELTGNPSKAKTYNFTVKASNSDGSASKSIKLVIVAPVVVKNAPGKAVINKKYNFQFKASGSTPIKYFIADGELPEGMTLSEKGKLSGTPKQAGTYDFTVAAWNEGDTAFRDVNLIVAAPPSISNVPDSEIIINKEYNFQFEASGTTPINYSRSKGSLPKGLKLDKTGKLYGTPTKAGTYKFTIKASNSGGSSTKNITITVITAPVITTKSLAKGTIGKKYSATIKLSGSKPTSLDVTGLPEGLTFNPGDKKISGKPSVWGDYNVTITASNIAGKDTRTLTLEIRQVKPKLAGSLASGVVEKYYSSSLKLSQGTSPITWSITKGTLPEGLELDSDTGMITGTPSQTWNKNITITAENKAGRASKQVKLKITAAKNAAKDTAQLKPDKKINVPEVFDLPTVEQQAVSVNNESDSFTPDDININEGTYDYDYVIVFELPEIEAAESKLHDFRAELSGDIETGAQLIWLSRPDESEPSEDDTIAEFYDGETGEEIDSVPDSHKINISAWLTEGITYKPAIAIPVRKQ